MDSNVLMVLLLRAWNILAGGILIIAIPRFLPAQDQGYYYTFLSIVAIQFLFDLGLSQTITQISSHEFAHVDLENISTKKKESTNISKLRFLVATFRGWYIRISIAFVIVVAIIGAVYFSMLGKADVALWSGPWVALVISTGLNLLLSPRLAFVEGAGLTGQVASLRLFQSVAGHALLVTMLAMGKGLWAITAVPIAANVCTLFWLRFLSNPYRTLASTMPHQVEGHQDWRREILGLQWRVAVAWLGGYFASQIIVPVVFALQGAEEAGRLGMALQIFTAIQALGMSWISARGPFFGQMISRGNRYDLNRNFRRYALNATLATALLATVTVVALTNMDQLGFALASRIPTIGGLACLAAVATANTLIYAAAAYMRAHKEEPLMISSLAIGALTFVAALVGAREGSYLTIWLYLAVTLLVNLPWTLWLFSTYYCRPCIQTGAGR